MQWLKPIQSTRFPPRPAFQLHSWMRHRGGRALSTKVSAWSIAARCCAMQRGCHWQLTPMLSATPSCSTGAWAGLAVRGIAASAAATKIRSIALLTYSARDVPQTQTVAARQKKSGDADAPPLPLINERLLAEVVRNVVEGRVQLVADALHRSNSGNGNEGGNQAVLNRSRTLRILDQLEKLDHLRS